MVTGESATIHCHLQDEVRRTKDAVRLIMSNRINWGNGTKAQSSLPQLPVIRDVGRSALRRVIGVVV